MNELTMEKTYLKSPYKGGEIGFIFDKQSEVFGSNGEPQDKGIMYILDPDKKLQSLIEGISPNRYARRWLKMGALVCIQQDKLQDAYHIVHNFIRSMKPLEEEIVNKDGSITIVTNKLY